MKLKLQDEVPKPSELLKVLHIKTVRAIDVVDPSIILQSLPKHQRLIF
jgi:hypothetical protein